MFFSSKKYSRYIYIYKKRKRRNYCYASVHIPMSACYEPLWYGQLPVMREGYCYYWWLSCDRSLCGHTITGLVQCCQHHLIGYYTSSLEKSHSLLFYRRILMVAIMVKSFKDISINIKTFNFFFGAEFIIFFFQFGFKGIIVLSGN